MSADFTDGLYVVSVTDGEGARDPIGLTSQVAYLRKRLAAGGHENPALILLVVKDGEEDAAVARIQSALDPRAETRPA